MSRVVVIGPGRSASRFMCNMVRGFGFETRHEETQEWHGGRNSTVEKYDWEGAARWLKAKDNRALCGYPYGFMVYYLRHRIGEIRVICIHRELRPWLKSQQKYVRSHKTATGWPAGLTSMKEYWQKYEHIMASITAPVLHLDMDRLGKNCAAKVNRFCNE